MGREAVRAFAEIGTLTQMHARDLTLRRSFLRTLWTAPFSKAIQWPFSNLLLWRDSVMLRLDQWGYST